MKFTVYLFLRRNFYQLRDKMKKNKGVANLIAAVILVVIVSTFGAVFFIYSMESTEEVTSGVENRTESVITGRGAIFTITDVTYDRTNYNNPPNVTILNNGKVDISLLELSIYLNNTRHTLEPWGSDTILRPGETAVLKILQ